MSNATDLLKRLYRRMQEIAHGEITAVFGQAWRGGKLDGTYVTIAQPPTSLQPRRDLATLGSSFPDGVSILETVDGEIYVSASYVTTLLDTPTLISPVCGSAGQSVTPLIAWTPIAGATQYELQVSTDDFATTRIDVTVSTTSYQVLPGVLAASTTYCSRVRVASLTAAVTETYLPLANGDSDAALIGDGTGQTIGAPL